MLLSLPPELLGEIIQWLDLKSRFRAAEVCRQLRAEAWLIDVTEVSLVVHTNTLVYAVNGCCFDTLYQAERAVITLLLRSHPEILIIEDQLDLKEIYQIISRLPPSLPASIEHLWLDMVCFDENCRALLKALAPSLKRIDITIHSTYEVNLGLGSHFAQLKDIRLHCGPESSHDDGEFDPATLDGIQQLPKLRLIQMDGSQGDAVHARLRWMLKDAVSANYMLTVDVCRG